jgi:hypothetical protein
MGAARAHHPHIRGRTRLMPEATDTAFLTANVLVSIVTSVGAVDPRAEAKTVLKNWAVNKIADRVVSAAVGAIV